jgi:hypothetical protein
MVSYPSNTFPRHYSNLYVEVYTDNSGQLGSGLASAPVTIEVPAVRPGPVVPSRTAVGLPSSPR